MSFDEDPREREPAEKKGNSASRRDGSEPFYPCGCQEIKTSREENDSGKKSPARNGQRGLSVKTLYHAHYEQSHGMKHLVKDRFFVDGLTVLIQDIFQRVSPKGSKSDT